MTKEQIDLVNEMTLIKMEHKLMKECLQWYADGNHSDFYTFEKGNHDIYGCADCEAVYVENGQKARDILKQIKGE